MPKGSHRGNGGGVLYSANTGEKSSSLYAARPAPARVEKPVSLLGADLWPHALTVPLGGSARPWLNTHLSSNLKSSESRLNHGALRRSSLERD